jgi:hypothetical protein
VAEKGALRGEMRLGRVDRLGAMRERQFSGGPEADEVGAERFAARIDAAAGDDDEGRQRNRLAERR